MRGSQWRRILQLGCSSQPTRPVAEVTAFAGVLRMLRAARVSIPLIVLSHSEYALGVVLGDDRALRSCRWSSLHGARRDTTRNMLASRAAMWADRLADRRWMVPERAAALISCAPPIPPEPEVPFFTLANRIFWQGIKDEVDPLRPFRPGRQCLEVVELTFASAGSGAHQPGQRSIALADTIFW